MLSQGPYLPNTAETIEGAGVAWTNPNNAKLEDGSYAEVTLSNQSTEYLALTNFGFTIPSNATISTIKVETKGYYSGSGSDTIFIREAPRYSAFNIESFDLTVSNEYHVVENTGNWWKAGTMTPADVNASNFGFAINTFTTTTTYYIDNIRVTVYYNLFNPFPSFYQ